MNRDELNKLWKAWADQTEFCQLNPEDKHTDFVIDGVLKIEKEREQKFCPCRLGDGTRKRDLELLCPCNFKVQKTWTEKGECWCGLFIKKEG